MLGTVPRRPPMLPAAPTPKLLGEMREEMVSVKRPPRAPLDVPPCWAVQLTPSPPRRPGHQRNRCGWTPGAGVCPLALQSPLPAEAAVGVAARLPGPGRVTAGREEMVPGGQSPGRRGRRGRRVGIDLRAFYGPHSRSHRARQGAAQGPLEGMEAPQLAERVGGPGMKEGDELPEAPGCPGQAAGMGHSASSGP